MMKTLLAVLSMVLLQSRAQIPDLDEFGGDLEFDLPGGPEMPSSEGDDLPMNHLFAGWSSLENLISWEDKLADDSLLHFQLPEGAYLVAPNVAGIPLGYSRIASVMKDQSLKSGHIMKVVLHADGNFSTALLLAEAPTRPVPPPLDISPVGRTHLLGLVSDIQILKRSNPAVLNAFVRLQQEAKEKGWKLDRREFIFLPIEPGRVFFGLELIPKAKDDKSTKQE